MVFRNRLLAAFAGMILLAFSQFGFAETSTIEVPQGTGVFPTIGQIKCLEELGSGRFCAATYECSDDSGELWGDLANHNGRRAIGATSPVANQRDCVITVDGKASVRWLTGYRPAGRQGELVGLTTSAEALRPVVQTTGTGDGGRSLLHYVLERYDTTLAELVAVDYVHCDSVPYSERGQCIERIEHDYLDNINDTVGLATDNALTRCLVRTWEDYCQWTWEEHQGANINLDNETRCETNVETVRWLLTGGRITEGEYITEYDWLTAFRVATGPEINEYGRTNVSFGNYNENVADFPCREPAEQELSRKGIGVRYCGDECDNPNDYELTIMEIME